MYQVNPNLKTVKVKDIPYIHILGRTGRMADPLPLFFNGSGIEVCVTGSDLWIELESNCDFHEPWIAYELNGAFMGRQMLLPGEHKICLFRNMTPGVVKTVRFYRELQAMSEDDFCKVCVRTLSTDGDFVPVKPFDMKIEFIGDSITSGEGTYGAVQDTDWLAMYMSASQNYATMTARSLNADYHLISQGGWGVYCGWDNDVRHNIPSVYEKVCGLATGPYNEGMYAQNPYDFEWQPDVIVVNLGTNDNSAFVQPPLEIPGMGTFKQRMNEDGTHNAEDSKKVIDAAVSFLKMLREHNPGAHIVWTYGMLGNELAPEITEALRQYKEQSKDENVSFLELPDTTAETFGAHMHPGVKSHMAAAKVLCGYITDIMKDRN